MKKTIPSAAQARLIARIWAVDFKAMIWDSSPPTLLVCVKRGWLVKNGATGKFLSGIQYSECIVSEKGLSALEEFLREARIDIAVGRIAVGGKPCPN